MELSLYSEIVMQVTGKSDLGEVLEQKPPGVDLGEFLLRSKAISHEELAEIYSRLYKVPYISLKDPSELDAELVRQIDPVLIQRFFFIPFRRGADGFSMTVIVHDPGNLGVLDELERALGCRINAAVASALEISALITELFPEYSGLMPDYSDEGSDQSEEDIQLLKGESEDERLSHGATGEEGLTESSSPVVKLVNRVILTGITERASDIHFEAYEAGTKVKLRIDGVLLDIREDIPRSLSSMVVSRIKIMSDLNIAERHLPQDGRFKLRIRNRDVAFRISILPSIFGESAVIRILDKQAMGFSLNEVGLSVPDLMRFEENIRKPYGMILVAGPTGSGKTSTLYTALKKINRPEDKIITIEDPVEYQLNDIVQVPVDVKKGMTFARGLRSIVRQDPDKILIGEIRDEETASIAVNAALTGHLVLTTIHSNNAVDTLGRLMNMGIEKYLFASAIIMIVSQRLVRKICKHCQRLLDRTEVVAVAKRHRWLSRYDYDIDSARMMIGDGCLFCNHTGFYGRIGVFEVMEMSDNIKNMILRDVPSTEVYEAALKEGMIPLRDNCFSKVAEGFTTLSEMDRVTRL
jgi:type IV pilus assembly protein PilB